MPFDTPTPQQQKSPDLKIVRNQKQFPEPDILSTFEKRIVHPSNCRE